MIEVFCPNVLIITLAAHIVSVPAYWLLWPPPSDCKQTDIHQNLSDKCCASLLWFIFSLPNWSIRTVSMVFARYLIDRDSCDTRLASPIKHSFLQPRLWARPASFQTSTGTFCNDLDYITENLQRQIHVEGKSWINVRTTSLYVRAFLVRVGYRTISLATLNSIEVNRAELLVWSDKIEVWSGMAFGNDSHFLSSGNITVQLCYRTIKLI